MSKSYIIYWCNEGLEAVVDITEQLANANVREKEKIFDIIKNPEIEHPNDYMREINRMVNTMIMRGMANTQRHYEIYSLHTTDEISKADLEKLFEESPQTTADLIRTRGTKIYCDRAEKNLVVIV